MLVQLAVPGRAANDTVLRHYKGSTGYGATATAFTEVTGSQTIQDNSFAITRNDSQATLTLVDSSVIGLGSNTMVQVSAVETAANGTHSATITVPNGANAWFRFEVKHPTGGQSNYVFKTPTSSVSVRGTVGLISSGQNGDTISCITCAANDV
ncbi:MAG: FecR domain-containing protein, partial [Candidatus Eremiobacteraeota bacterium]|nr:FecR domain-containing protein [Candidatus Eremiobacteraeota bacterium]